MVEIAAQRPEVCSYCNRWRNFVKYICLTSNKSYTSITAKSHPIQEQRWIVHSRCDHWHRNLRKIRDQLSPESESQAIIQPFNVFIFGFQPGMPVFCALWVKGGFSIVSAQPI